MFSSISCEECTLLLPNLQALVAEMVGNFGKRLEPYGVKVGRSHSSSTAPRARPPVHSSPNSLPLHAAAFPQECHATCLSGSTAPPFPPGRCLAHVRRCASSRAT